MTVARVRYSGFEALKRDLEGKIVGEDLPPFPGKLLRHSAAALKRREKNLSAWTTAAVAAATGIWASPEAERAWRDWVFTTEAQVRSLLLDAFALLTARVLSLLSTRSHVAFQRTATPVR